MKKLFFQNTYKQGRVTFLIFPDTEGKGYLGVCLEFDLVVRKKTREEAGESIKDYAILWHRNIVKNNLSEELLNKPADKKYWKIYEKLLKHEAQRAEAQHTASHSILTNSFPNFTSLIQFPYQKGLYNKFCT